MLEKRKHTRIYQNLSISYRILENPKKGSSFSKNISEGGICFPSIQEFSLGISLEIKISLQELPNPLIFEGEIKRLTKRKSINFPFEVGIIFTKADPSHLKILKAYIQKANAKKINENIKWIKNT